MLLTPSLVSWTPRQTIYLGDHAPKLDSLHEEHCVPCSKPRPNFIGSQWEAVGPDIVHVHKKSVQLTNATRLEKLLDAGRSHFKDTDDLMKALQGSGMRALDSYAYHVTVGSERRAWVPWPNYQQYWDSKAATCDNFANRQLLLQHTRGNKTTCCPPVVMTIGCGHCGTSAMGGILKVLLTNSLRGKEPMYFSNPKKPCESIDAYTRLWPDTGPAHGKYGYELTPGYGRCSGHGAGVAANIAKHLPRTKFLVFIRDATSLMFSLATSCRSGEAFDKEARNAARGIFQGDEQALCPLLTIKAYLRYFPIDRFLFISSERFQHHTAATALDVVEFLGVPFDPKHHLLVESNSSASTNGARGANSAAFGKTRPSDQTRHMFDNIGCYCARELRKFLRLAPDDQFVANLADDNHYCADPKREPGADPAKHFACSGSFTCPQPKPATG